MEARQPCVYILASRRNGTLYVGVTSDLPARVWQHRNDAVEGFTSRYRVHDLAWKVELIQGFNPEWRDLYADIV